MLNQKITVKSPSQSDLVFDQLYTYDSLNRITSAEEKTGTTVNWNQTYMFDRYGNRNFNESLTTTLPKGCMDGGNPVVCLADRKVFNPQPDPANNRLTSTGWQYDAAGNTTRDGEYRTFTYDGENKQVEVRNSSNAAIGKYWYDGDGKRVKKVVPGTGETTIFVYDAAGKLIGEYSTIVANSTDAKVAYPTSDHLGSPRINTDAIGSVTSRSDYLPYGEELTTQGNRSSTEKYQSDTVRQRFTGYEMDGETELDFAKARIFINRLGRFSSTDPLLTSGRITNPQSWNRYLYTLNYPLLFTDPTGMYECQGSDTQCKKFRESLTKAQSLLDSNRLSKKQKEELKRALDAYGSLGDKNGVTVRFGTLGKKEMGRTEFSKSTVNGKENIDWMKDNGKGEYVPSVTVTLADGYDEDTIFHEGSHTADRQQLVVSLIARTLGGEVLSNDDIMNDENNVRKYETEKRAYLVSSSVNQAQDVETEVWQKGWKEGDTRTIQGINNILKNEPYKVGPDGSKLGMGPRLLEFEVKK